MPTSPPKPQIPGADVVGRGLYLRPDQPYELKLPLLSQKGRGRFHSVETDLTYTVPGSVEVDDGPPLPAGRSLNQSLVEESWDRFERRTGVDASATLSQAPFSVDVSASQTRSLRQEEESYYALRTSFIPLWALYVPHAVVLGDDEMREDVPTPFTHRHRDAYTRFFDRHGTHLVRRAWVGGKATLALTISKQTELSAADIQAGLNASMAGAGGAALSTSDQRSRERLQSNSRCTVFGSGGDSLRLAALTTLDDEAYNQWVATVKDNPQVIELEAVGIWTLVADPEIAAALQEAYREETYFPSLRVVFNLGATIYFFEDSTYYTFDTEAVETTKPRKIREGWGPLADAGFETVDAAFVGRYLRAADGTDLSRKVFFFNRDRYVRWDVETGTIDAGYPRLVAEGWPGVTFERIDATVNAGPDAVYFFAGNSYIRFNMASHQADGGYPDVVSRRWTGVDFDRIDAATYWGNGKVYFFRGNRYIRYDTVTWRADPGYPKVIPSHYVQDWRFFE